MKPGPAQREWTHAQKKRSPVASGFFGGRHLRYFSGRNPQRLSSSRIACNRDGSGSGTDRREVVFDDNGPECRESWSLA
jgi:hypothetical protein